MAGLIISQSALANPLEKLEDSWYIGGGVGQSRLQPEGHDDWEVSDKNDLSKKIYGGINIGRDFGLEAFWNDLGVAKVTSNNTDAEASVKYKAFGANVVYHVPTYMGAIHPIVKLGVAKVDTKGEGVQVNQKNKFDIMAGVGAEYQLSQGFRVRAEYERFDKDIDQLSVGLNWRPVLNKRPIEAPRPVVQQKPVVVQSQPVKTTPQPKPVVKTVIKHVPVIIKQPAVVKTVVKHAPAPKPVVHRVVVNNPPPAPKPVVHRVVVNNPPQAPKPQPRVVHKTLAGGSNFATNSATLTRAGRDALGRMASDLLRDKVAIQSITIIGHTDNVGSHASNQSLSKRRAESVASYLSSRGINRGLMNVIGRGEVQPVANNATGEGRAKNRRVNITVKGSQTIMPR